MTLVRWLPPAVFAAACVALAFVPPPETGFGERDETALARVLAVDDSKVSLAGLVPYGTQELDVELLEGAMKGHRFHGLNELRAQPEIDKTFAAGDTAVVTVPSEGAASGAILTVRDHWRLGWAAVLFGLFALLVSVFGGAIGVKALASFVFSCFAIWKLLVPLCLRGWDPVWTSFGVVAVLTAVIMYLVAGATKTGLVAFLGASLGILSSLALARVFTVGMHVTGATMPYAQALLNSGYADLNLADLFVGAIILASSGAVMDLAMDIASGIGEVVRHNPGLGRRALFSSGINIGRAVVGTMTTTLLLAYSGGYLTLLMVFAAQGTPPLVFLNSTLVSAELVKTLVGSFGLVLVAPFTALVGAALAVRRQPGSRRPRITIRT